MNRKIIVTLCFIFVSFLSPNMTIAKNQGNAKKIKILFIHHSTGANLIKEGELRKKIYQLNSRVEFWDHNYNLLPILSSFFARYTNYQGLTDNSGNYTGKDYNIVVSNNSPKEYAEIFSRNQNNPTLQSILSYDIIIFKNCFSTTIIKTEDQLKEDKKYYMSIRNSLIRFPTKQFILLTPPPARKEITSIQNASRAKKLTAWLQSEDFLQKTPNINIFDLFGKLSDENGFLKSRYIKLIPFDSHPNLKANQEISLILANYINEIANKKM